MYNHLGKLFVNQSGEASKASDSSTQEQKAYESTINIEKVKKDTFAVGVQTIR